MIFRFTGFFVSALVATFYTILTPAPAFADPHVVNTYVSNLRQKPFATSSVRGTGHWIETYLSLSGNTLKIKHNFINDNRTRGYTGCASVRVFGPNNTMLIDTENSRGVNGTGVNGRKTKTEYRDVDLSGALRIGISRIEVNQRRCPSDPLVRLGSAVGGFIEDLTSGIGKPPVTCVGDACVGGTNTGHNGVVPKSQGLNSVGFQNCITERDPVFLWYRDVNKSAKFTLIGEYQTAWRGSLCPGQKVSAFPIQTAGFYEFRVVYPRSKFCSRGNNPDFLGCVIYKTIIEGNPDSTNYVIFRVD